MILVSIDPGINRPGYAIFRDGVLIGAGTVKCGYGKLDPIVGCYKVAQDLMTVVEAAIGPDNITDIAVEWPQIYTRDKSLGDPNDNIPLAGICSAFATMNPHAKAKSYKPKAWVDSLPKKVNGKLLVKHAKTSARGRRIFSRLSKVERLVWDTVKYHDAVDAIGIGLHYLDRFKRYRVLHGTT